MLNFLKLIVLSCMINPLFASHFYVGGTAGYNITNIHNTITTIPIGGRINFDDQHHALNGQKYALFFGFRKEFNDYFFNTEILKGMKDHHIEISYLKGKRLDTFSYKDAISLHVKIGKEMKIIGLDVPFDFYVLGGVKNTMFHLKNVIPNNNPVSLHTTKFSFVYGAGLEKKIKENISLRIEYISSFAAPQNSTQRAFDGSIFIHKVKFSPIHQLMIGLSYHFN